VREQVIHFVNKKMPGGLPKKTARALLDIEDKRLRAGHPRSGGHHRRLRGGVLLPGLRLGAAVQPGRPGHPGDAVARGRADRAAAGLPVLRLSAARLGQFDKAEKIITDNRVLFHRVANTLNYLDIKTVVVSCGTCFDQLQGYEFDKIFPGCRIVDIHEFLLERASRSTASTGTRYMYHDPCHSADEEHHPLLTVKALMNARRTVHREERALLRRVAAPWR
jgi:hypothetical protein